MTVPMTPTLAVLMDPIEAIYIKKDSTFAMLLEAQRRGYRLLYLTEGSLALRGAEPWAHAAPLEVRDDPRDWFTLGAAEWQDLRKVDVILARKDPPVDSQFLYDTMVFDLAEAGGAQVINHPRALRDANEKLFTLQFPQCIPPTLVARDVAELKRFAGEHGKVVLKPLDGMGGRSIFLSYADDPNLNVIIETLLGEDGRAFVVMQKFIPEISAGDKRILLIDGVPVPHALARIPQGSEIRGNLAVGGKGVAQPLSARDREIAEATGPVLAARGLLLVGLDVIGDCLTEINVTSPTGFQEISQQSGFDVAAMFVDALERALARPRAA